MANTLKFGGGVWATKKGSTLAYNDENNNFKPLPFDFSRASSATRVNKDGLIETVGSGEPRIDFKDNTKGALLLEPQRTNNFQQSNQFDTTWQISAAGVLVTPNQVGVGNSQDAWKLTEGTYNGEHFIRQTPNIGGVVSISVYAKAGTNDFLYIRGVNSGLNRRTWFNLSTGTVGTNQGISAEMISMGDGWYRCVMVLDHQTAFEYYIAVSNADGVSSYQGSNNYIYIQNAQLEEGSYATSYIPTSGSAVTRIADSSIQTLPSPVFNSYPFSVFAEVDVVDKSTGYIFSLLKLSSSSEYFTIEYFSNVWHITARPNGSTQRITSTTTVSKGTHKIVGVWESSSMKLYLNGSLIASGSNSKSFNSQVNSMLLGQLRISGDTGSRNTIRQTYLYNNALTDAEAIALTS